MPDLNVASFLSTSTVDYPGELSAVLWLGGCPFRCGFCQNADVALGKGCERIDNEEVLQRIKKIRGFIDALTVTGGEPTMQADGISDLLSKAKALGLLTQVNTNGYFPSGLARILPFLDYVSIDIKNEMGHEAYERTVNSPGEKAVANLRSSLAILKDWKKEGKLKVEVRTTVVPGLTDESRIIESIAKEASFADVYVLRRFRPCSVLDKHYQSLSAPSDEKMEFLLAAAKAHANAVVRG